ncbi:hypothetical protein EAG_05995 [Camponotus floridanus]|uniref:Uncharacterized protein n=1 Tax=Camponotus floridanus TaxID=104421 RepID=E2AKS7_CAMFO|nr:hypothetical protein EAG_05995 [Camponotus floridanus]
MEKQLEALNIDDSFESDQESSRTKIIRTFSFPSSQVHFCKTSKELKLSTLDKHYSEQILYPNIYAREPALLEMQTKRAECIFYNNSKVPEHFWHPRIDNVPSTSALTPADDPVEYMEIEKYPDSTKHDTTSFTPMLAVDQTEVMEVEKFMKPRDPAECMDLSKSISMESLSFAAVQQAHTNMLKSAFDLESKPSETNEDITKLIPTRRKFRKTSEIQENNLDHINENNEDKKQKNYQDTKKKIHSKNASQYSKIKTALCIICFVIILIFVFLLSLHEDQDDKHSNTFTTAIVELKKEIFGQDRAVQILIKYLQQDSPFLKIIALVGGTGVGKSYTVEIIRKNFYEKSNNHFFSSRADLFILENLRDEHLLDVIKFVKMHQKTYDNRYGTIFVVFNVEQMNDNSTRSIDLNKSINIMKNTFANANLDIKIIPYESLSEDALEKCIKKIAKNVKLTLSQDQIVLIKRQLIENNTGCKGAYGKIQVIGRQ